MNNDPGFQVQIPLDNKGHLHFRQTSRRYPPRQGLPSKSPLRLIINCDSDSSDSPPTSRTASAIIRYSSRKPGLHWLRRSITSSPVGMTATLGRRQTGTSDCPTGKHPRPRLVSSVPSAGPTHPRRYHPLRLRCRASHRRTTCQGVCSKAILHRTTASAPLGIPPVEI